ncbi:MAG: xanthine dehydrogenase family protein subunit [Ilumatobacteraceae bacterium]|nr:xanthine dehydrogenase family protein subunit [Ilumatobacteraceae bacterium]
MTPLGYARPRDVADALDRAAAPGAMFIGGGTNLVDLMKLGVETPAALVDVGRLGLDRIEELAGGGLRIGAAVRNSRLAADARVRQRYPVLAEALVNGASGQLRNMATVGGNLLQRTRCAYFQDTSADCNKRVPGSGCSARAGDHRNLAILGGSPACIATHPSDMAVAMVALDAVVNVRTPAGTSRTDVRELHRLPGSTPHIETVLAAGSLIESVDLPAPVEARSTYRKVRDRASFAFAVASVAAIVQLDDRRVRDVRIALGAVAPRPWRASAAEDVIRGESPSTALFESAIAAELADAEPLRGNAYKVPLLRNLVVRVLCELCGVDPPVRSLA